MGLYSEISNNKEYAAQNTALNNRMNGVSNHSVLGVVGVNVGVNVAPQLLTFTIGKLLNGSKKSNNTETSNTNQSEDARREQLNKDLKKVLNEIGAANERDINEAVSRKQDISNEKIAKKEQEVKELKDKTFDSTNDPNGTLKAENDRKIKKAEAELEKTVKAEKAELEKIEAKANEAYKILEELAESNKINENDTVVVEEKQEALKGFNEARKGFLSATTPEDKKKYAQQLKDLYEANTNDGTIMKAYQSMLQEKVEAALKA